MLRSYASRKPVSHKYRKNNKIAAAAAAAATTTTAATTAAKTTTTDREIDGHGRVKLMVHRLHMRRGPIEF